MRSDSATGGARSGRRTTERASGPAAPGSPRTLAADAAEWTGREPEVRVAGEFAYCPDPSWWQRLRSKVQSFFESLRADRAPGIYVARKSDGGKHGIRVIRHERFPEEERLPVAGIGKGEKGWEVSAVPDPDSPGGTWDPYRFMPSIVFNPREDSFPVAPDSDGDGNLLTDAASYEHGRIGGSQPLTGAFHVSRKGEYTVLTYSFYYVDNKQATYHLKDSSTMAVYLAPGSSGKLEPRYLYSSWHYGANLARWEDLGKDADGRPIVEVERGSHALHPLAIGERPWRAGLAIRGDGTVSKGGRALPNRLTWQSFQPGISGTVARDPADPRSQALLAAYFEKYPERRNPIHPSLFASFRGR
ncbi:MAG: hypothetical protein FJZ01_10190 [Candidatus Sericytochromatia bacterium]|nr:hypothetical protein [Candidatus Tanganyikabacteria bacterium]